ncbi:MAG: hypothetical protein PHY46_01665 [Candidatus Omnitrophica bacterium]|nr:hypothetical protein [Candidatus Omnitrophota bacterium]MDD5356147.1 hypothetical protein [Candidatus Omnitrophota bacterium]
MLKKLMVSIVVVSFVLMLAGPLTNYDRTETTATAADNVATFSVDASIPQYLEINAILRTVEYDTELATYDINWDSSPSSLDFGTLVEVEDENGDFSYMAGANTYAVVMYPITSGRSYSIVQSGGVLQDAQGNTIPNAAYVMTPDYQNQDLLGTAAQGAMPIGASLAAPQSAVGNNHTVYTSDANGTAKVIRAFLAITGPDANGNIMNYTRGHSGDTGVGIAQYYHGNGKTNWSPVTKNQPSGSYSGSVTFTVNL